MDLLNKLMGLIDMLSGEGVAVGLAIVLELGLRLFKSEKPRSILLGAGLVLSKLALVLGKLSLLLDKIIPQRISPNE